MKKKYLIISVFLIFAVLGWLFFIKGKPTHGEIIREKIGTDKYETVCEYKDEIGNVDVSIIKYDHEHEIIDNKTSKSHIEHSQEYAVLFVNKEDDSLSVPWLSISGVDRLQEGLYVPSVGIYSIVISHNSQLDRVKYSTKDGRIIFEEQVTNPYYLIINPKDKKYDIKEETTIEFCLFAKDGTQLY